MMRLWLALAGINGLISVAAGAWGWHGMLDDGARRMIAVGTVYEMAHALALLGVAWLATRPDVPRWATIVAGLGFAVGNLLFSGSLYWFAAFGALPIRGAAPVGGTALMIGWAALIAAAVVRRTQALLPP
jgi:uncharacterized membrane protein YgdD (TMEM256/DUF423 family)